MKNEPQVQAIVENLSSMVVVDIELNSSHVSSGMVPINNVGKFVIKALAAAPHAVITITGTFK